MKTYEDKFYAHLTFLKTEMQILYNSKINVSLQYYHNLCFSSLNT